MKNARSTATAAGINQAPMSELTNYHQQLLEKYKGLKPDAIQVNADNPGLMTFNGYYTLNSSLPAGAFFAIDTNMLIIGPLPPVYFVDMLISLDGKTSTRFSFTGTFDGSQLTQNEGGLSVSLTFTRTDGSDGTTAACAGTITLPGQSAVTVSGSTYNNMIPSTMFSGRYYVPQPTTAVIGATTDIVDLAVLQIEDYGILYDNGMGTGQLHRVPLYVYNMNMYFFTALTSDLQCVLLIMGSAAEGGLACNNMPIGGTQRSLQTIQCPVVTQLVSPNPNSQALAAFSGYYPVSIAAGAFVSIEGEYTAIAGSVIYRVKIGVSLDGVASNGYYFEAENMTFVDNVLTMPDQSISITFNRAYDPTQKSLVTITGAIGPYQNVNGYTLFKPVPLSVFGGVAMTNAAGDSLTIVDDTKVIYTSLPKYDNATLADVIYVPIMYILAYPSADSKLVMSFGTNSLHGNSCIVTDYSVKPPKVSVVSAIPNS
jgi:hypothetical protein